ncbi:E3 ubiquitin-protein ligase LRSAM1 isoform X2 [Erpetoichthys calabaricus]|uniref:E3 ubiquitin-protein ligase LRSAM1 isoform X2 n=1 Tax=Erpetoichthys calabaricus TaxID=27687 RepID=UPI002234719B|nr:E3 ubiquitin-protein ligase LRSAM1 isoform X2 [Erpetoichthys calabaricus]
MPLFFRKKKPSEDAKKRLEYQLCLAREAGADDILDISACELSEIPASVFSTCKVLQKKVFIVHDNQLRSLVPRNCSITDLSTLKVLDIHGNSLTSLPDDIGQLRSLQILNLEKNRLQHLPESIGELGQLQTLNVRGNCLSQLRPAVGRLGSLRSLDVSENGVRELPVELGHIRTLETLTLDATLMAFPPAGVCSGGTECIQRFLCAELGTEYCPPSQYLLPVLENEEVDPKEDIDRQIRQVQDQVDAGWQNKFQAYEKKKEQKTQEKLEFERRLGEEQREQAQLILLSSSHKEDVLESIKQEQQRLENGVSQQQRALQVERQRLLEQLRLAEDGIGERIELLLLEGQRQREESPLFQDLENERLRLERLMAITQEEAESLRRKEVAAAMQQMLSESYSIQLIQEACESRRQRLVSETYSSMEQLDKNFERVLSLQHLDQSRAISRILQEAEMQKVAFEALQLQRDGTHRYIRRQEVLSEQRRALSDLLQQLLKQKDQREAELRDILVEMQLKSEAAQENYWLIQYQRLLDSKPLSLQVQEAGLPQELVNLLRQLSAHQYLPILAHHRVTQETLRGMTPADLLKLGIVEVGVQHSLLAWARALPSSPLAECVKPEEVPTPVPSAPPLPLMPPSAQEPRHTEAEHMECVVCMENESQVVFLPCGHICCCLVCSEVLRSCPLCRSDIAQHIRIYRL